MTFVSKEEFKQMSVLIPSAQVLQLQIGGAKWKMGLAELAQVCAVCVCACVHACVRACAP